METLFLSVQKRIAEGMPELLLVDEDYGQLELTEDGYPVTFPCALIEIGQVPWTDASNGLQTGVAPITVKLAIDCYDDTQYTSGTANKVYDRMMMAKKMHLLLQTFAGKIIEDVDNNLIDVNFSPLTRTTSSFRSLPGGIKVYEMSYSTSITDRGAVPVLLKVPKPSVRIETATY